MTAEISDRFRRYLSIHQGFDEGRQSTQLGDSGFALGMALHAPIRPSPEARSKGSGG
jgi:hypothetical protein